MPPIWFFSFTCASGILSKAKGNVFGHCSQLNSLGFRFWLHKSTGKSINYSICFYWNCFYLLLIVILLIYYLFFKVIKSMCWKDVSQLLLRILFQYPGQASSMTPTIPKFKQMNFILVSTIPTKILLISPQKTDNERYTLAF